MNRKKSKQKKKEYSPLSRVVFFILTISIIVNLYLLIDTNKTAQPSKSVTYPRFLSKNKKLICENEFLSENGIRACPKGSGLKILPRYYPIHSIFMGYYANMQASGVFQSLLGVVQNLATKVPLFVMLPKQLADQAIDELDPYLSGQTSELVRLVHTPSSATLWAQDYFELAIDLPSKKPTLFDLPYMAQVGEHIPSAVALACNFNLIGQASVGKPKKMFSNYGGNIEAIHDDLVLVGNNMSGEQKAILRSELSQEIIEMNVGWIKVGHVDEVVSLIPKREDSSRCPFDLFYASPQKAIDLMGRKAKEGNETFPLRFGFGSAQTQFDLFDCYRSEKKGKECRFIFEANKAYESYIKKDILQIKSHLRDKIGCPDVKALPVPVLFTPSREVASSQFLDSDAISLDPNPINNLIVGNTIFLPQQKFGIFHSYIRELLKPYNYKIVYLDNFATHQKDGGLHCMLNIRHTCQ